MWLSNYILNQGGAPAILEGLFANRPAAGVTGRIYVSTDTFAIYRDNGTGYDEIGGTNIGFVPYTGANATVDLNTQILKAGNAIFSGSIGVNVAAPLSTAGGIDIGSGGFSLITGADNNASTRTDNTSKLTRWGMVGYSNAQPPSNILNCSNGVTVSSLNLGGGAGAMNAMTRIAFYTAANNTTLSGTEVARFTENFNFLIGTTADDAISKLQVNGIAKIASRLNINGATDNASYQLNVVGSALISGSLEISNAGSGITKGDLFVDNANKTVFVGRQSTTGGDNSIFTVRNRVNVSKFSVDTQTGIVSLAGALNGGTSLSFLGFALNDTPSSNGINQNWIRFLNTGSDWYVGSESSVAGGFFTGSAAYASVLYSVQPIQLIISGIKRFEVSGTAITLNAVSNFSTRANINGATDNSLFALNVNGTVNGSSPSFTGNTYTVTGNLSQQFYHVFTGAVGQTLTAPTPSGNNSQYLIINNSANVLTVAAFSGTNIITTLGATSATITLAANARTLLIADGNNKYYQAF